MSMNIQDKLKFVDVCVEIIKCGKVVKCEPNEVDLIIAKVDHQIFEGFGDMLRFKANAEEFEDPDVWDEWYDNLSLEKISAADKRRYGLPDKKIVISEGNENALINRLLVLSRQFIKDCKPFNPKDTNIDIGYDFSKAGIFVYFISHGDRKLGNGKNYDNLARIQIDKIYSKLLKDFEKAENEFNNNQGPDGVHVKHMVYRGNDVELNCHTGRSLYITEEDLFYTNKLPVEQSYCYDFFKIACESGQR